MKIEQGYILEVKKSFLTSCGDSHTKRPVQIQKGEKIEIRYPYQWHFRTEDNEYYHAKPEVLEKNCEPFGIILEEVRWHNKASLSQILEVHAYRDITQH
jgi:hypothetical protein